MKKNITILLFMMLFSGVATFAQNWTVMATYTIPGKAAGLAWDGTYLYSGLYSSPGNDNIIYQIDPSDGSYTQYCAAPQEKSYGLTYDGQYLWSTDRNGSSDPAIAVQFDENGNLLQQFDLPETYVSGIEYDNGDFWVSAYYPDPGTIFKLDNTGTILEQFTSPGEQPWAICLENGSLWVADYNDDMLYKIDQSGTILESHPSEGIKPSGIVYDGQFLWYCDGQTQEESTLYKIDLSGVGTPVISLPLSFHDFGITTIGSPVTWNMIVENTGTADLTIDGLTFQSNSPLSTGASFPQTIEAGNSIEIPIEYNPQDYGMLEETFTIQSSDPITPDKEVEVLGSAVFPGAVIHTDETEHNYEVVRINAYTGWFVNLVNHGNIELVIDSVVSDNPRFIVTDAIEFPVTMDVQDTIPLRIWYNPQEEILYNGTVSIYSDNATLSPVEISLSGDVIEKDYTIGDRLWNIQITGGYDTKITAIQALSDITGDGVDEVIVCSETNVINCYNGNSAGIADLMWSYSIGSGSVYHQSAIQTVEDINNDGYADVIAGTAWGDRAIIAISGKTGNEIWKHYTNEYGDGGWVYQVDCHYDYNGDGITDVLAAAGNDSQGTGPKRVYCLDATTGTAIWERPTVGAAFSVIGIHDVTGDGIADALAGATNANETEGTVYGIDGSTGAMLWDFPTQSTSTWALAQLADVNEDGFDDVLAGDFSGNIYALDATNGNELWTSGMGSNLILRFEELADVNGDEHPDILIANSSTNCTVLSGYDGENIWFKSLADKSWSVDKINDITGDNVNDVVIGTLYENNYCYFLDGTNGNELETFEYYAPVDAIGSIPDIVGDYSGEMVAGGRDGNIYCYSGGLNAYVSGINTFEESVSPINCMPNPFVDETTFTITLKNSDFVRLTIYDVNGTLVKTLINKQLSAGTHSAQWNGSSGTNSELPSGLYFYRLESATINYSGKVLLVK